MKTNKIATSATKEGITKLLNQYCYSTSCYIDFEAGDCFNSKGKMSVKCKHEKGRYILY